MDVTTTENELSATAMHSLSSDTSTHEESRSSRQLSCLPCVNFAPLTKMDLEKAAELTSAAHLEQRANIHSDPESVSLPLYPLTAIYPQKR